MVLFVGGLFLNSPFISLSCGKHQKHQQRPSVVPRIGKLRYLASTNVNSQRNPANYQSSLWSYDFVQSLKNDYADVRCKDKAKKLQENVRVMIKDETAGLLNTLELIDSIQRLGLAYLFKAEIADALDRFVSLEGCNELHAAALRFRILREHGFDVSSDIFKSFKDQSGEFKACHSKDVKGMLSLYEATFLGFEGESVLDEARTFANLHLADLKANINNKSLLGQVSHALELPVHRTMRRLEARQHIEAYEKREDANSLLLEAAKLDFNMVLSTLQEDLQEMSRWWKGMGLATKLSFSRDRLMECFFWSVGMAFEPQYSDLRKGLTKVACLITTIDDLYDVYGTYEELELFTAAVQRWDIKAMEVLPDFMNICFLALHNTVNEMAYDTLKEQGQNILPYLTKAWADMLEAFLQEARWSRDKLVPSLKDYLRNAWISSSGVVILVHAYFLRNQDITKEALDSLDKYHDLLRLPSTIFRLCNDLVTSKAEVERGETANSILCYMLETGDAEDCAYKHIKSLVDETWKKMNKYLSIDSPFPRPFVETAINLARISHCTYQYGDGIGAPDSRSRNRIRSLIIEPITICRHSEN